MNDCPTNPSPIDQALSKLGAEQGETERLVSQLIKVLKPVCRPGGSAGEAISPPTEPQPVRAPLEEATVNATAYQKSMNRDLHDLLARLAI